MAQFNSPAPLDLPEPKDLSHHLSKTTKARAASSVKSFYKYFAIPGIAQLAGGKQLQFLSPLYNGCLELAWIVFNINEPLLCNPRLVDRSILSFSTKATCTCAGLARQLELLAKLTSGAGLPNQSYFPYDTLEARVALPDRWTPTPNKPVDPPANKSKKDSALPDAKLLIPKTTDTPDPLRKIDLASALQYGTVQGYPPLYQFLTEFTHEHLHPNVPYKGGPEIILTVGNTDGFAKCIQAFVEQWHEGDPVSEKQACLCEEYAYMNAIQQLRPNGVNIVPVGIDDEGMRAEGPGGLRDVLENWDFSKGKMPHMMYTITYVTLNASIYTSALTQPPVSVKIQQVVF